MVSSARKNLTGLFKNARTRTIILLTAFVLIAGVVVALLVLRQRLGGETAQARVTSIPTGGDAGTGQLSPTPQYAKLQEEANVQQAQRAKRTGESAIPSIIRLQRFGEGQELKGVGEAVGFTALARAQREGGIEKQLWFGNLKQSNCSPAALNAAIQAGATLGDLITAGCKASQLLAAGITMEQVCRSRLKAEVLKAAGFTATQLKACYSASDLRAAGFSACQLKGAGFTAAQLKDAGFGDDELRGAGFSQSEIRAAGGLPEGITADDVRRAGCGVEGLRRLKAAGVSARAIREISNCTAAQMLAAGFTPKELRDAGYSLQDLLAAGLSPQALKDAGFSAADLRRAGLSAEALKAAGFNADQLKKAGFSATALKNAGFGAKDLFGAGYNAAALKDAGFSDKDLENAGVPEKDIDAANKRRLVGGLTIDDIRKAGCDAETLKNERIAGITALQIRSIAGCTARQLKAGGFNAQEIKDAGFTAAEMRQAGFTAGELRAVGFTATQLKLAGFRLRELKQAGFSAKELHDAGYSALQLKAAGFDAKALKAAGFSATQLRDAGFNAAQLKNAGFTARQMKDAGFTAADLKMAGFDAKQLRAAGFTAPQLREAGFTCKELVEAGFSLEILKPICTYDDLRKAGVTDLKLRDAAIRPAPQEEKPKDVAVADLSTAQLAAAIAKRDAPPREDVSDKQLQQILARQSQQQSQQRLEQELQRRVTQMRGRANQILSGLQPVDQRFVAGVKKDDERNQAGVVPGAAPAGAQARGQQAGPQQPIGPMDFAIKAGDILFAVLDTAVNSDEPGPVLATIVSGKLRGSRLIGSLNRPQNAETVVLNFTTLSVPKLNKTISVNAIAIDPKTARIALSSNTDRHVLERYGTLFAASFMQGFGNALQSEGTQVFVDNGTGTTVVDRAERSLGRNALVALSTVGRRWANLAQPTFNRPPTVEVYSGTNLGILFSSDVQVPLSDIQKLKKR